MATTAWAPPTERLEQVKAFMAQRVLPNETAIERQDAEGEALLAQLQDEVRAAGLWAPHVPPEAGGTGTGFLDYAYLNEHIGRSMWGQRVFGCQAPDAGNAEILHMFGTDEQKEQWLQPLVAGQIRSFFSMTEPAVPGSDPTTLRTRAVRDADHRARRHARRRHRPPDRRHGSRGQGLVDALRGALHRRPNPGLEHARRRGRRLPD